MIDWKKNPEILVPRMWLPWVSHAGSMTQALEQASGVACRVAVQQEGWAQPWSDELEILMMSANKDRDFVAGAPALDKMTELSPQIHAYDSWVREVVLTTHRPVMFARTIFPKNLIDKFPELASLGKQPLGKTIFSDGSHIFQRGNIEFAQINHEHLLWQQVPEAVREQMFWARRSLFHSEWGSFLLSEVFFSYVATL